MRISLLSLLLFGSVGSAQAELILYGFDETTDQLLTIDAATGVGTAVGPLGFGQVGDIAGNSSGRLFGSKRDTDELFSIDVSTGTASIIGSFGPFSNVNGLAFDPTGVLHGFDDGTDQLITIDTTTGAATAVVTVDNTNVSGISFDSSGTLYGTDSLAGNLLEINLATGVHTVVGGYGIGAGSAVSSLSFDDAGVLYAADAGATDSLYTVDVTTGEATSVGATGFNTVSGLSFAAVVPEPSAAMLCVVGLFGLSAKRRRRQEAGRLADRHGSPLGRA